MPPDEDDPPTARRRARRDRVKSPNGDQDDDNEDGDPAARRRSAANFSASKLMESLKETNQPTATRLRRGQSSDGLAQQAAKASASESTGSSRRRPPSRTMSAQAPRSNPRRARSGDADMLSQSMIENPNNINGNEMDGSNMSGSQTDRRRRGPPQRTRSAQDSCLPRGHPGTQRTPRARRRPEREDSANVGDDSNDGMSSSRRRVPNRTRSQDAMPPRGAARASRPGRRRPNLEDDDEDVIISDSDEEHEEELESRHSNHLDRSNASHGVSSRRRVPQRTRSTDSGVPTTRGQRTPRSARRRPSTERADASPKRSGGGPGLMRSNTTTPPSSSSGPGLARSNTATNPRSNRNRGSRNTAQELAQVTASNRERSPDPASVTLEGTDMDTAREGLRQLGSKHSVSPIKSRQERRQMREAKEREALERRMPQRAPMDDDEDDEVVAPAAEKKEEPWMRRLKKSGGSRATNDDSFSFEEVARQSDPFASAHDKGGGSLPRLSEGKDDFFPVDPSFGVFAAEPLTDMNSSFDNGDDKHDAMQSIMDSENGNKLDFSTIA